MEKSKNRNIENLIGLATLFTLIIGFAAVLGAIFCFLTGIRRGDRFLRCRGDMEATLLFGGSDE